MTEIVIASVTVTETGNETGTVTETVIETVIETVTGHARGATLRVTLGVDTTGIEIGSMIVIVIDIITGTENIDLTIISHPIVSMRTGIVNSL